MSHSFPFRQQNAEGFASLTFPETTSSSSEKENNEISIACLLIEKHSKSFEPILFITIINYSCRRRYALGSRGMIA